MGEVYEAEHVRLGSRVAVKFLRASALSEPRAVQRFHREARAAAALRSEHVATVFDCGQLDDGTPYLVMERLFGEDLHSLLSRTGKLPVRRAVKLVHEACVGLSAVHAAGLIHRDLKPANLFVAKQSGGMEVCKILDFGVAKVLTGDATRQGIVVGTLRYMAPEQLEDGTNVGVRTDIYSLGAVLYECLTGAVAHRGETPQTLMFDILNRDVDQASTLRSIPLELDKIVARSLSRNASQRFPSAEEFARELLPFMKPDRDHGAAEAPEDHTLPEVGGSSDGLHPVRVTRQHGAAGLAGALGLGIVLGWVVHGSLADSPAEAARRKGLRPDGAGTAVTATNSPASVASAVPLTSSAAPLYSGHGRNAAPGAPLPVRDATRERVLARRKAPGPAPSATRPVETNTLPERFDSNNPYGN